MTEIAEFHQILGAHFRKKGLIWFHKRINVAIPSSSHLTYSLQRSFFWDSKLVVLNKRDWRTVKTTAFLAPRATFFGIGIKKMWQMKSWYFSVNGLCLMVWIAEMPIRVIFSGKELEGFNLFYPWWFKVNWFWLWSCFDQIKSSLPMVLTTIRIQRLLWLIIMTFFI